MTTFRAQDACQITEVGGSTLRAWHNRLGFLPRPESGWREYDLQDLIAIRVVAVLTGVGMAAGEAVEITHVLLPEISAASRGLPRKIAVGRHPGNGTWEATPIDHGSRAETVFDFGGEVSFALNLKTIVHEITDRCRQLQGLPTLAEALAAGKVTVTGGKED